MPIPKSQWEKLMPGYVACVDEPASYYWKQLWETYPEALVILSTGARIFYTRQGHFDIPRQKDGIDGRGYVRDKLVQFLLQGRTT